MNTTAILSSLLDLEGKISKLEDRILDLESRIKTLEEKEKRANDRIEDFFWSTGK